MEHTYTMKVFMHGRLVDVEVEARDTYEARMKAEAQYGDNTVKTTPRRVS